MQISFFKESNIDELKLAINDIWAKNHILSKEDRLIEHMFKKSPAHNKICGKNEVSFLGAWDNGKIIGLLGVLFLEVNVRGEKELGACLTNWIVIPEYRNTGAGMALLDKVIESNPSMILSLGINRSVAKLYQLMKWKVFQNVPRWIGLVDRNKTLEMFNVNAEALKLFNEITSNNKEGNIRISNKLDKDKWNDFYWNGIAKKTLGFARDFDFLNWRYLDHPYFNYEIIICESIIGQYLGLAVVRKEKIESSNLTVGRIVEFIAEDQVASILLANKIAEFCSDVLFIDFYCFSAETAKGLESIGFKKEMKQPVLPTNFQPVDYKVNNMMASVYLKPSLLNNVDILCDQAWYVTKGDSDQDRPN
ncbi:GNAT family N-acetyltransferase [Paenibacillus luteus]|uniref:GNAT family N-acetyltransferase n=1 Tax=Paenibacillus luteus TaxID=2545753 RepID=UPI001144EBE8|nr:GNAT family N-acetyltransferase [Paenibacillus luteus]